MNERDLPEAIRARIRPDELLGHHPMRAMKPGHLIGTCPLHTEKTPSFHVWLEDTPRWHCFGCKQGGDVIDLAMALMNIPFPEALRRLAAHAGLERTEQRRHQRRTIDASQSLYEENGEQFIVVQDRFKLEIGTLNVDGSPRDHDGGLYGPQHWPRQGRKVLLYQSLPAARTAIAQALPAAYLYGTPETLLPMLRRWNFDTAAIVSTNPRQALLSLPHSARRAVHFKAVTPGRERERGAYLDEHDVTIQSLPRNPRELAGALHQLRERLLGDGPFDPTAEQFVARISQHTGLNRDAIEGIALHGPDPARIMVGRRKKDFTGTARLLAALLKVRPDLEPMTPAPWRPHLQFLANAALNEPLPPSGKEEQACEQLSAALAQFSPPQVATPASTEDEYAPPAPEWYL